MKKQLLGACVATLVAGAANAAHFTFTDWATTITSGAGLITGSFDGHLGPGGIITNLSNAVVFIDGTALSGNGAFYVESFAENDDPNCTLEGFCAGGAQASLDGSKNNFLFIDTNYAAGETNFTSYYYSITDLGQDAAYNSNPYVFAQIYSGTQFSAQLTAVPEPASWALMLGGFGMIGGALRSRRKAAITFG